MARNKKIDRKHVFRRNLKAFMKQAKLDKNSLTARLGLDRDGRKWLGRLLSDGLDRTNSKSEPKLQQLCEFIGLESTKQLWDANLKLNVSDDFHIEALKTILKEGGSPARDMRSRIERSVDATAKAIEHLQACGDLLTEDQERVAMIFCTTTSKPPPIIRLTIFGLRISGSSSRSFVTYDRCCGNACTNTLKRMTSISQSCFGISWVSLNHKPFTNGSARRPVDRFKATAPVRLVQISSVKGSSSLRLAR